MDFGIIEKLANCIVRPPKSAYSPSELGSPSIECRNRSYQRDDFTVINNRSLELQCSFIRDKFAPTARETIIFLHANSSCRLVIKNYIDVFLPYFDLLAFDFAGCGRSEGQYVTLGYNEKEDVYSVVSKVRERYGVKELILWGRSMGAATAIFYAAKYGGVKAIISDNSFSDLDVLVNELSDEYIPFLPGFLIDTVIDSIQEHIEENIWKKEMTDFNIRKLKPLSVIAKVKCPIFFIGSLQDSFVNVKHTRLLYQKARAYKKMELVKGDHNDLRSKELKEKILKFLLELNHIPQKERFRIFRDIHGSKEQECHKDVIEEQHEKIEKTPYCLFPNRFMTDREALPTDENDKREPSKYAQELQNKEDKKQMLKYCSQMQKAQERISHKSFSRNSVPKRRKIFDGVDILHKKLSQR